MVRKHAGKMGKSELKENVKATLWSSGPTLTCGGSHRRFLRKEPRQHNHASDR